MKRKAIIGVDGLSVADTANFDFPGEYETLPIETTAHTCPSWNAILSGRNVNDDDVYDFFATPDEHDPTVEDSELAKHTDEMFDYADLRTDRYLWERFDVDVVSAPIVLPTFSNVDDPPGDAVGWPTTRDEVFRSIDELWEATKHRDRVVTVFPVPDKANHLRDNPDKDFDADDRRDAVGHLEMVVQDLTARFDEWVVISDHGEPSAHPERVDDGRFTVATHDPIGVVASNAVDVSDETNVTIYDRLVDLLQE